MNQLSIDFVHQTENNPESQAHLDNNREKFNGKCLQVLSWLREGKELTVLWCANNGVASLPRRIGDLKSKGITIHDRWENGVKVYFINK